MLRELNIELPKEKFAIYIRLACAVRSAIQKGQIRSGEMLPSTRALANSLGLHRHTVMAALEELVSEGWVIPILRKGYQVAEILPSSYFEPKILEKLNAKTSQKISIIKKIVGSAPVASQRGKFQYSFQGGMPDLRLFPTEEFRHFLSQGIRRSSLQVLDYTDPSGYPPLVEELKIYLRRMRGVSERSILVTHGSQEAIFIVAQLLLSSGDKVGVEELGYTPAWEALKVPETKLIPISIDSEGIIPESFERAIKKYKLRLLYLTPLHQYPTTVTMPIPRRMEIYSLAAKYGIPIIEDDYDHEFHYRSHPLPPLAASDPSNLIFYVSTFSKVVFPSARIGFLAIPSQFFDSFNRFRRIMTRQNDSIIQDATARWMRNGGFERHLRKMRRVYEGRRNTIVQEVDAMRASGLPVSLKIPDGGMAIWLNTRTDADRIAENAEKASVYVTPESKFQLQKGPSSHLRLGFANQSENEIHSGMRILSKVIRTERVNCATVDSNHRPAD